MSIRADASGPQYETLTPPRLGARPHLWALLGYFCLALVVTYPLILHFTTTVPGDLIADRDQNLWNLWWVGQTVTHFTNPFHTNLLFYPYGTDLYYHTLALPLGIIGLIPQALLGLPAAYNTVVLVAFTLSGYGAFRLGLLFTDKPFAAFLGGIVFAFTPYTLDALKGQTEVMSIQWIPLYAEAWLRAQGSNKSVRHALIAGIFLALALLSSLYYGLYLLLFTLAHALYSLAASQNRRAWLPRVAQVGAIVAAVAFILTLPLLIGLARDRGDPRLAVLPTEQQRLDNSADLLSFITPPLDHPLLGTVLTPSAIEGDAIHSSLTLSYIALALAVIGAVVGWRNRRSRFWVWLGIAAAVLALGPQLQVARNVTAIPLPFKLLEWLPGWDGMAKVERLVVLVRLCMGVLAVLGMSWILDAFAQRWARPKTNDNDVVVDEGAINRAPTTRSVGARFIAPSSTLKSHAKLALPFAAILALLLFELPIHPRDEEQLGIPQGFQVLNALNPKSKIQNPKSALLELPFATRQAETMGRRMLFQTSHGFPITGGYLARTYTSPITDECSPFWGFISAAGIINRPDIGAPTLESRPLDVLRFYNIGSLAIYNTYGGPNDTPLTEEDKDAFLDIANRVSTGQPFYSDSYISLYTVNQSSTVETTAAFHIGNGWHDPETSGGVPFRWMSGNEAKLCVFTPQPTRATLTMENTSFGEERTVKLSVNGSEVYSGSIPSGGAFATVRTTPIDWSPGITEVSVTSTGHPITPESLDPNQKDDRPLTIGAKGLKLEAGP